VLAVLEAEKGEKEITVCSVAGCVQGPGEKKRRKEEDQRDEIVSAHITRSKCGEQRQSSTETRGEPSTSDIQLLRDMLGSTRAVLAG
jgi:hypothetical protein